jgi:23S rRNA (guanine745-N1)-methyltransferase
VSESLKTVSPPLSCSVRGCGLPLTRAERAYVCAAGHSFDIARGGYINLLQPQDRRSSQAGDSKAAVDARAMLEQTGVGRAVIDAVIDRILALTLPAGAVVVDLGCGSGELLGSLSAQHTISAIGIDLSTAAIGFAARRFPALTWVVANADRRLPLQDHSVDIVLSVNGRRNPSECARVLTATGVLFVVLPAADDLIELRTLIHGRAVDRDRVETLVHEHERLFGVIEQAAVRETSELDRSALLNLLQGTYRGARLSSAERVRELDRTPVTFSSSLVAFRRR